MKKIYIVHTGEHYAYDDTYQIENVFSTRLRAERYCRVMNDGFNNYQIEEHELDPPVAAELAKIWNKRKARRRGAYEYQFTMALDDSYAVTKKLYLKQEMPQPHSRWITSEMLFEIKIITIDDDALALKLAREIKDMHLQIIPIISHDTKVIVKNTGAKP